QIYEIHLDPGKTVDLPTRIPASGTTIVPSAPVSLVLAGQGQGILALAGSGNSLYACETDKGNIYRVFPNAGPVTFTSIWGWRMTYPGSIFPQFGFAPGDNIGFVPDPYSER